MPFMSNLVSNLVHGYAKVVYRYVFLNDEKLGNRLSKLSMKINFYVAYNT
jgi:hypothetical protein